VEEVEEEEPEPVPVLSTEEALAPFLKFFQVKSTDPDAEADAAVRMRAESDAADEVARSAGVSATGRRVRYYDPKPGDFVAGVVVRTDGRTIDVDIGAGGEPALMLSKEALPVPGEEFGYLACDVGSERAAEFATEGRVGVVVRQVGGGEENGVLTSGRNGKEKGAAVAGVGAIVFAEVLGRTLGGRPLVSARRLFRRVAWHRVRQVLYANPSFLLLENPWNNLLRMIWFILCWVFNLLRMIWFILCWVFMHCQVEWRSNMIEFYKVSRNSSNQLLHIREATALLN
jgi:small subunit ribosomal protein S1